MVIEFVGEEGFENIFKRCYTVGDVTSLYRRCRMAEGGKSRDIEFTEEEINKYIDMLGGGATKIVKVTGPMRKMLQEAIAQGKNPNKVLAAIKDAAPAVSGKAPVGEVLYPRGTPPPTLEEVELLSRAAAILAGVFGASYLKNKSQEKPAPTSAGGGSPFDMLSHLLASKEKFDQETVDTIKKIAEVISPDKTAGEVLLALPTKTSDTFGESFDEAVTKRGVSKSKSADEVGGRVKETPQPKADRKKESSGAKEGTVTEQVETVGYAPSNTAGVAIPEDTTAESIYAQAGETAKKRAAAKSESESEAVSTPKVDSTTQHGGGYTPKEEFNKEFDRIVSMDERLRRLEDFVQSLTGRKDES